MGIQIRMLVYEFARRPCDADWMLSVPCILSKPRGKPKIRRQLVFNKAGVKVEEGGGGGVDQ